MKEDTKRKLLDFFFTTKCPVCGSIIEYNDDFCENCKKKLRIYDGDFYIDGSDGFYAAYYYDESISPAIILLKDGTCGNADYALGNALGDVLVKNGLGGSVEEIIPVPLHASDRRKRGFNQTELISEYISAKLKIPVEKKAVIKKLKTNPQKTLSKEDREKNLTGAFDAADEEKIKGKRILLVDDVCTTGSTLSVLTDLLIKHGACAVYCASCCKTPSSEQEGGN